jgi:hypothetical protein
MTEAGVGSQDGMLCKPYGLVGLQYLDLRHGPQVQATSVAHCGTTARHFRHKKWSLVGYPYSCSFVRSPSWIDIAIVNS